MSDPPPILDYQPPQRRKTQWVGFVLGLVVGVVLTFMAVAATVVIALAASEGHDTTAQAFVWVPIAALAALAIGLAVWRRTRRFGLGMFIGAPLTIMVGFVICGGLR